MAIIDSQNDLVKKLTKILNIDKLENVHGFSINVACDNIVSVTIERYLDSKEIEGISSHLEKEEYILVRAEDLIHLKGGVLSRVREPDMKIKHGVVSA